MVRRKPTPAADQYDNGNVRFRGANLQGKMHGPWKFFRRDGSLMRSGSFDRGTQVGVWRTYDRAGNVVKETHFSRVKSRGGSMTSWTNAELSKIAAADELEIAPRRRDGTLQRPVTIWVVRHGDDLHVRSVNGSKSGWFKGTQLRHEGRISAGGVKKDVKFEEADVSLGPEIDRAYRTKYHRYAASIVNTVLTRKARATTLRLVPKRNATRI